jgi:hypothetical protein
VIDMSKIRMDFATGEISDRSFYCIDYRFFQEKDDREKDAGSFNQKLEQSRKEADMGQSLIEKTQNILTRPSAAGREELDRMLKYRKPGKKKVEESMFGFVEEDEEPNDENGPVAAGDLENPEVPDL